MYRRLTAGEFGNTIPQYFSVEEWSAHPDSGKYGMWGVRSATQSAHPACKLYVPRGEVAAYAHKHFPDGPNISMMVDTVVGVTAWLELWDSPSGLVVEGVQYPEIWNGWNWRNSMREPARRKAWSGTAARMVLARHLNANSLEDVMELLERFPDHVVELSALTSCMGSVPHRNSVIWECRLY